MHFPITGYFDASSVRRTAAVLADGGVAVLPTDTIYGFHCAASRTDALERIRSLKARDAESGFILLVADLRMAGRIVSRWPGDSREILGRVWPGPLTAILPARKGIPAPLAPRGTVALRIPAHADLRSLIVAVGEPLVSTSVNLSGEKPLVRITDIECTFPGLDAYISKRGRSSPLPSTIVDFTKPTPVLVRVGKVHWPPRRD